jgi:hypothetical protein
MSIKRRGLVILVIGLVLVYVFTPFVAGLIGTHDRRGPKIFWVEHHELLYMIGFPFTHDRAHYGTPKEPLSERAWFYGMEGKPLNLDKKKQELDDAIKADETKHPQKYL